VELAVIACSDRVPHSIKDVLDAEDVRPERTRAAAKVEELAGRGFTLRALLRFYGDLPSYMPHYDPERSTTNDVVRQVIIPRSAAAKTAFADLMHSKDAPRFPAVMVTHNWGNLFCHLIAAIVADALGSPFFFNIVSRLDGRYLDALLAELEEQGVSERTYWVCAFSVNQHVSICDQASGVEVRVGANHDT